jgi:hypothetical protein
MREIQSAWKSLFGKDAHGFASIHEMLANPWEKSLYFLKYLG